MAHERRLATTPLSILLLLATLAPATVTGAEETTDRHRVVGATLALGAVHTERVVRSEQTRDAVGRAVPSRASDMRVRRARLPVATRAAIAEPDDRRVMVVADARARDRRADSPPSVTLEAPTGLTALRYKPHVVLTWTHSGASTTGYEVERSLGLGKFRRIGTPSRDARTFRDRTSTAGFSYVYRIRAVGTGTVSPYSKELIVLVEPESPAPAHRNTSK